VLPEDTLLDVHYEDLVENQEATTRMMLEFVGCPSRRVYSTSTKTQPASSPPPSRRYARKSKLTQ
jgi:hypothetical protein